MAFIVFQLRDGSYHQGTVTSMEPNEGTFVLHTESTKVVYLNLLCSNIYRNKLIETLTKGILFFLYYAVFPPKWKHSQLGL